MMENVYLSVKDYTEDPGPRYKYQDIEGEETSGEMFYIKRLNSVFADCIKGRKQLVILLDGVSGYPSSFLDEAIGELIYDFTLKIVKNNLQFDTVMFKRRAKQVLEETYPQWETKRIEGKTVFHSPGINATLVKLDSHGEFVKYTIQ